MRKYFIVLIFLTSFLARGQILARYDVSAIEEVTSSRWRLTGTISDETGSYTALDADINNRIIMRGVSTTGKVVFDRFVVVSVNSATVTDLVVEVTSDMDGGVVLNNAAGPVTGNFPICTPILLSKVLKRPSVYQAQIDPDYDAGISNLNAEEQATVGAKWDAELSANAENNWTIPFALKSTATILYNGTPLRSGQWSGSGTTTLSVTLDTRKYDKLVIIN